MNDAKSIKLQHISQGDLLIFDGSCCQFADAIELVMWVRRNGAHVIIAVDANDWMNRCTGSTLRDVPVYHLLFSCGIALSSVTAVNSAGSLKVNVY